MKNLDSRFSYNPVTLDMKRSRFKRPFNHKTSFNVGDLIPFYVDEVLPGDTRKFSTSFVVRTSSPLVAPIMDNLYMDIYYFFVPYRLVWDHWRELMGENTDSAWVSSIEYSVPQVKSEPSILVPPGNTFESGSLGDYMGIPISREVSVSALPFRAYALIVNEWFRDENLQDPVLIDTGDNDVYLSNGVDYVTDLVKGGKPFTVAKYHDYFTSALPAPQKGNNVPIPVNVETGYLPVLPRQDLIYPVGSTISKDFPKTHISYVNYGALGDDDHTVSDFSGTRYLGSVGPNMGSGSIVESLSYDKTFFNNLYASLDPSYFTIGSINDLRLAFQLQKLLEKDALGGTRYTEILRSHFGVTSPDSRLQRPEYLGGSRVPLNINQVVQSSSTTEDSPIGNVAGYSVTSSSHGDFSQSFTEHGVIIGLSCVRYHHSYQQGLNRMWSRKTRYDFYWPVLANIGETAIKNSELYLSDNTGYNNQVFGYQEAWADYRYKPSIISGELNSNSTTPLDMWHLGDDYSYDDPPFLSDEWIREDKSNLDRCLTVTSDVANQFICDFYVEDIATRPMPLYSVPGLIDHH